MTVALLDADTQQDTEVLTPPTTEQWRALYKSAMAFRNISPWNWMGETQIFGLVDPVTAKTWYLVVRGAETQPFSLIAFNGAAALDILLELNKGIADKDSETIIDYADLIPEHDYLIVAFGGRTDQREEDLQLVQTLKLKLHGARDWPLFRAVRQNSVDWLVSDEEGRILQLAVDQALDVARRKRTSPDLLPERDGDGPFLVRVPTTVDGTVTWGDETRPKDAATPAYEAKPGEYDPDQLAEVAKLPAGERIAEADIYWSDTLSPDSSDTRQHFVRRFAMHDASNDDILMLDRLPREGFEDAAVDAFLRGLAYDGHRIAELHVRKAAVATIFGPVVDALGIELKLVDKFVKLSEHRRIVGDTPITALSQSEK
jgi:hypothetical protein